MLQIQATAHGLVRVRYRTVRWMPNSFGYFRNRATKDQRARSQVTSKDRKIPQAGSLSTPTTPPAHDPTRKALHYATATEDTANPNRAPRRYLRRTSHQQAGRSTSSRAFHSYKDWRPNIREQEDTILDGGTEDTERRYGPNTQPRCS